MKYAVWSVNQAQTQLLQYAAHPFNYTEDRGRSPAGPVNYETEWAMDASLLKWLHILSLTYKSQWTLSDNQFISVLFHHHLPSSESSNKSMNITPKFYRSVSRPNYSGLCRKNNTQSMMGGSLYCFVHNNQTSIVAGRGADFSGDPGPNST